MLNPFGNPPAKPGDYQRDLPMDQQYDTTKINKKDGDFYAFTVQEAEDKGYRRAHKWHS